MVIKADNLNVGYSEELILEDMSLSIPKGKMTALVGANGSGKSTLLKALSRLLKIKGGSVLLYLEDIFKMKSREVAKKLSLLPQNPLSPEDITVFDLVRQGRFPYQTFLRQWTSEDERVVREALEKTGIWNLREKKISTLSGGQKQRVWLSLSLAQETDVLMLDEPTNHLDIKYKIEILELLYNLSKEEERTIIVVLHDINLACRFADYLIAIKDGKIYKSGTPQEIVDTCLIKHIFEIESCIISCPLFNTPFCIPYSKMLEKNSI